MILKGHLPDEPIDFTTLLHSHTQPQVETYCFPTPHLIPLRLHRVAMTKPSGPRYTVIVVGQLSRPLDIMF